MIQVVVIAACALLLYRVVWHRVHHLPRWTQIEAVRIRGSIVGGRVGLMQVRCDDGAELAICTAGARVVAWPGPGAWRLSRGLRVGDPVTVLFTDDKEPTAQRIIRGRWPRPPLPRVPSAVVGILLGIGLLHLIHDPLSIRREIAAPSVSSFLLDTPDVVQVRRATSGIADVYRWGREPGVRSQSLLDYVSGAPSRASGKRRYLYLQPIGPFDARQEQVTRLTARFLSRFFFLPLRIYGQASLTERVGVLSMYRYGVQTRDVPLRLVLLRTMKVAAHETGHMFSMQHCNRRACLMSDHNDREEADLRFPVLCPECLAKLLWATRCDPARRYASLAAFCDGQGLTREAELYTTLRAAVESGSDGEPHRLALH